MCFQIMLCICWYVTYISGVVFHRSRQCSLYMLGVKHSHSYPSWGYYRFLHIPIAMKSIHHTACVKYSDTKEALKQINSALEPPLVTVNVNDWAGEKALMIKTLNRHVFWNGPLRQSRKKTKVPVSRQPAAAAAAATYSQQQNLYLAAADLCNDPPPDAFTTLSREMNQPMVDEDEGIFAVAELMSDTCMDSLLGHDDFSPQPSGSHDAQS